MLIWRMAPLCLMWCIWRERNAHSFEDCETGLINLKKLVIQTLFMWSEDTVYVCVFLF